MPYEKVDLLTHRAVHDTDSSGDDSDRDSEHSGLDVQPETTVGMTWKEWACRKRVLFTAGVTVGTAMALVWLHTRRR
jgi:hypothetical protein